jgi:hypothetical protein
MPRRSRATRWVCRIATGIWLSRLTPMPERRSRDGASGFDGIVCAWVNFASLRESAEFLEG